MIAHSPRYHIPYFSKNKRLGRYLFYKFGLFLGLPREKFHLDTGGSHRSAMSSFLLDLSAPRTCNDSRGVEPRAVPTRDVSSRPYLYYSGPGTRDTANKAMLFPIYRLSCVSDTLTYTWLALTPGWLRNILRTSSDNPIRGYLFLSVISGGRLFIPVFQRPSPDRPVWRRGN